MRTASSLTAAHLCSATPEVLVVDNRGLSIRTLQYDRSAVGKAPHELVTQRHFNALGQLSDSTDPRLYSVREKGPAVKANFRYRTTLSGQVLQSESQDAGCHITFFDVTSAPIWQENSRGFIRRFSYDQSHRINIVSEQDGAAEPERVSDRYIYGERPEQLGTFGRLMHHYDPVGLNETLHYNILGKPLQTVRQLLLEDITAIDWPADKAQCLAWLEPECYKSSSVYNAQDEILSTVDAQGNQQHHYWDVAGRLMRSGMTLAGESEKRSVLTSISYSAGNQVLHEIAGNGVSTTYAYETRTLRPSRLKATRPALAKRRTLLQDFSYAYDPVGNIISIVDAAIDTRYASNQRVEAISTYKYNALYQLCSATGRESGGARRQSLALPAVGSLGATYSNYTRQYHYDRAGNLIRMWHVGHNNYTLNMQVSDTSNRAVEQTGSLTSADVERQFDAAGNLKHLMSGQPLRWDGRNQLQQVTQLRRSSADNDEEHYQYDSEGARVRKTSVSHTSGTTRRAQVIYLPGLELRRTQVRQGATITEEELHVLNLASAGRQQMRLLHWVKGQPNDIPNDQLRGSLGNQINSSVLELNHNADILTHEEYYPFGGTAVWLARNTNETKYKFVRYSGKERDATGLYYYGFRYYAPWLARWLNPDPRNTVDGLNLYRMVRNNPVTLQDDNGLMPKLFKLFGSDKKAKAKKLATHTSLNPTEDITAETSRTGGSSKTLPSKNKLIVTGRDLSVKHAVQDLGGAHKVELHSLRYKSDVVIKKIPPWALNPKETVQNEIFAYKFSKKLKLDMVPETTTVQGNDRLIASRYIESRNVESSDFSRASDKMFLFDYLLNTGDRNNNSSHNVILGADGKNYAIDNETILGTAILGDFVTENDIKQEHIDLFFENEQTKIKFIQTDWDAFFSKHAPDREPESKAQFLQRIAFVKQRIIKI